VAQLNDVVLAAPELVVEVTHVQASSSKRQRLRGRGLVDELLVGLELPGEPPLFLAGHPVPPSSGASARGAGLGQCQSSIVMMQGLIDLPVGLPWSVLPTASQFDPSIHRP